MQSLQKRNQQITRIVQAVKAVIDKSWIPEEVRGKRPSWFARSDIWVYIPKWDQKLCEICAGFAFGVPFWSGAQVRSAFPYLEVIDEKLMLPHVHPNCRCELLADESVSEEEIVSKEEAKQAFIKGEI